MIVAALGALYNNASSPNDSPSLYTFKNVGYSSVFLNFLKQLSSPLSTTYKTSPS